VGAYWWDVEELGRKFILTSLLPVLLPRASPMQVACAVFVCCGAHVLHGTWKPYESVDRSLYYLQHSFLFATFCTYFVGLCYKVRVD
jgi:hypothetical protein